jgi:hypothetical protein
LGASLTAADTVYYWFAVSQTQQGPVFPQGKESIIVEEQAAASLVFLLRGHYHRCARIVDYFRYIAQKESVFQGFSRAYTLQGIPKDQQRDVVATLYVLNTIAWYSIYANDDRYLSFADTLFLSLLRNESPEGGFSSLSASDTIFACSVFGALWNITKKDQYRFASYRMQKYLTRFLYDTGRGAYYCNPVHKVIDPNASQLAAFVFGRPYPDVKKQTEFMGEIQSAVYSLLHSDRKPGRVLAKLMRKQLIHFPDHSAAFPAVQGGTSPDIMASAWYLFLVEGASPYCSYPDALLDSSAYFASLPSFTGEDFETGKAQSLNAYSLIYNEGSGVIPKMDWVQDKERSMSGMLHVTLPAKTVNVPVRTILTRRFLIPQNFLSYNVIKFFTRAAPGAADKEPWLKLYVSIVDGDGEAWLSNEILLFNRASFNNTVFFNTPWKKDPGPGNGVCDFDNVRELRFVFEQHSNHPWDISLDNIVFVKSGGK